MNRNIAIANCFSRAALSYDMHAMIPKLTAKRLFHYFHCNESTSESPKLILEIGAGTGILTQHLMQTTGQIILADISHPMLKIAQRSLSSQKILPIVVDAEHPCFTACFDIIISNLAFHWFSDPKATLLQLIGCLKPGGRLYLSCLGSQTFHEWRTVHACAEAPCGILDFINLGELKSWFPIRGERFVEEEWYKINSQQSLPFLRSLKKMGANLPHPGYKPLPHKMIKKIMSKFDKDVKRISYQILYAYYHQPLDIKEE